MAKPFSYSSAALLNLESALSTDRLSSYLAATGGDRRRAIALYEWNSAVSAAFYIPLQAVEIALRNACHRELARLFGPAWHEDPRFRDFDGLRRAIEDAKECLGRLRSILDTPHIVAELPFGFWTTLLSRRFEHVLWAPGLRSAFSRYQLVVGRKPSRRVVADRFDYLRAFRNRIAHHEPIFSRRLAEDYESLLEVAGWMYPDLADWTAAFSSCADVIAAGMPRL